MSKDEWERGAIKFSAKAWPKFRISLIKKWNERQENMFSISRKIVEELRATGKGKRNYDYYAQREGLLRHYCRNLPEDEQDRVERGCELVDGKPTKLPLKKDFRIYPISRGTTLRWAEARCRLDDKSRTLLWGVDENNRSVEDAWDHPMGKALDTLLSAVEWTRGTGGEFDYQDEPSINNPGHTHGVVWTGEGVKDPSTDSPGATAAR